MHGQNNGVLRKFYTGGTIGFSSSAIMKNVRAYPRLRGSFSSVIYNERQKSCTTILIVFLFKKLTMFEKIDMGMDRQTISIRFYASDVKLFSPLWRNS